MSSSDATEFYSDRVRDKMHSEMVSFCSLIFVTTLIVSDVANVKVLSFSLFDVNFLLPAGTLAFSISFIVTDVLCEIAGRGHAVRIVFMSIFLRMMAILYFNICIGDSNGVVWPMDLPSLWTPEKQDHYHFVLKGTIPVALAGLFSATISFMNDLYFFNYLRTRHRGKNLFWLRNATATTLSQIINSTFFISLAFGWQMTISQIMLTIGGQLVWKILFALVDAPIAYVMKNYGQGRRYWYAIWSVRFWRG
jgi:uncharacterized integral membrane protein (TIGR00697 family)